MVIINYSINSLLIIYHSSLITHHSPPITFHSSLFTIHYSPLFPPSGDISELNLK